MDLTWLLILNGHVYLSGVGLGASLRMDTKKLKHVLIKNIQLHELQFG